MHFKGEREKEWVFILMVWFRGVTVNSREHQFTHTDLLPVPLAARQPCLDKVGDVVKEIQYAEGDGGACSGACNCY